MKPCIVTFESPENKRMKPRVKGRLDVDSMFKCEESQWILVWVFDVYLLKGMCIDVSFGMVVTQVDVELSKLQSL